MQISLSAEQSSIVESSAPEICCLCVPGSGKTTVLVARIKRLIDLKLIAASDVVVITYTVDAANELKKRIGEIELGFVGTLHSFAFRFLQQHARCIGFSGNLTLMDEEMSDEQLQALCEGLGWNGTKKDVERAVRHAISSKADPIGLQGADLIARTWYAKMLETGALSFDGIIYWTIRALRHLKIERWMHLFWDEGQDMSEADFQIFSMLPTWSRFLVGDENQAIYGFRGGSPEYLLRYSKEEQGRNNKTVTYKIQTTRRFTPNIAEAANKLIANNPNQTDKRIVSELPASPAVRYNIWPTFEHECQWISSLPQKWDGTTAVLVPTNFMVERYATALTEIGLTVSRMKVPTYPSSWRKAKLILAACANPENDLIVATAYALHLGSDREGLLRAAAKARKSVNDHLDKWLRDDCEFIGPAYRALTDLLGIEDPSVKAIDKILSKMDETVSVQDLLAVIAEIEREAVQESPGITVATMHASKGREWDTVFLPGLASEVLPGNKKDQQLEEARRLMYVAITRARRSLFLSCAEMTVVNQFKKFSERVTPSRFINEAI